MKPDKIYVVHYTKLGERLAKIAPILNACGVEWEIITEGDKEKLRPDIEPMRSMFNDSQRTFEHKIGTLWDGNIHKYRALNLAEISCTIKHFIAMKKLAEECDNFGLIIEDDVVFEPDFAKRFADNLANTPESWNAIFLGSGCGESYIQSRLNNAVRVKGDVWKVGHPATNCAEAYLLKPEIAKKMWDSLPFSLVSDWEIAYLLYKFSADVYWWVPSLVSQGSKNGMFKSELDMGQRG